MDHISSIDLFVHPPSTTIPPDKIKDFSYISSAARTDLIDLTHSVITAAVFPAPQTLRVWELRLTLLIFEGKLAVAKQEGINLNRSIYLHENPDHPKYNQSLAQTSARGGNGAPAPPHAFPLPRNNEKIIPHLLLLLLLRLKSTPSMGTVNECYRVCYQLRLRGLAAESTNLQKKLMQLVYLIIVELIITKNTPTLVSYLESLVAGLQKQIETQKTEFAERYLASIRIVEFLAHGLVILRNTKDTTVQDVQFEALRPEFALVMETAPNSLEALRFSLNSWAPFVGGPAPEDQLKPEDLNFEAVVSMLRSGRISTRIICCTLAVWDLDASFNAQIVDGRVIVQVDKTGMELDDVYVHVMAQWAGNVNRVFCIE